MPGNTADPPEDVRGFVGMGEALDYLLFQKLDIFPEESKILL
jgi:hypothetical protein